jgi:CDGSH-type Zn-finger protein/uncharacterized Fe-S cluster protein YjdI
MKKNINILKNGPMVVQGIDVLYSQAGRPIPLEEGAELCRCGESFNKPFCDGNHIIFEFDESQLDQVPSLPLLSFVGAQITVYFDRSICSHRGICYETLPEVFKMIGPEGILPDKGDVSAIVAVCQKCPSGALSFSLPNAPTDHSAEEAQWELRLAPRRFGYDGPIEVRGHVSLNDQTIEHYALCRCGHSKNMPYCTGTHWQVKFTDENNDA